MLASTELPLLLVSASARALARSAARDRLPVVALDLFNDLDTRELAIASRAVATRDGRLGARRLLAAAAELCPPGKCAGVVYGSGFEGRPRLLQRLAAGRRLFGNAPEVVRKVKDPAQFFPLLDALGIAHPATSLTPPRDPADWLVKRRGGAGGAHVRRARGRLAEHPQRYFQKYQAGRTLSVLFAADGHRAQVIGFNEQWSVACGSSPFCYAGATSAAEVSQCIKRHVGSMLDELVRKIGLIGLNGLDFILAEGVEPLVLEINPRPTATLELHDLEAGMLRRHLLACTGVLEPLPRFAQARAHAIAYASGPLRVPVAMSWPDWCTDLPAGGSEIPANAPVCSVHATAASHSAARQLAVARLRQIEDALWGAKAA